MGSFIIVTATSRSLPSKGTGDNESAEYEEYNDPYGDSGYASDA